MLELNVCLLLPKEISQKSIELSQSISSNYPTEFTLDLHTHIPHISLYHLPLPESNLHSAIGALENFATQASLPIVTTANYENVDTYLSWNINPNPLLDLQARLLVLLNPLRQSLQRINLDDYPLDRFTSEQRQNIQKYGYPSVGNNFQPHITLTRFTNLSDAKSIANQPPPPSESFKVKALAMGKVGPHGTLPEIISKFELNY